jgi:hypothetical protein
LNHRNDARRGCRAVFETLELRQLLAGSYLIGNSMTDGVRYNGLTALLGRDGSSVTLGRQTGPGYSQAYNLNLRPGYWTSGADPARAGSGDPWGNYVNAFANNVWDALTLQPAERRLLNDKDPAVPSSTQNQGDVPMTLEFMKRLVQHSPNAQVFGYSRPVRRTDINDQQQPTGLTFDYSAEWKKTYIESGAGVNNNLISRSYMLQYMSLVREGQQSNAALARMKPIRLIPAGEAFYNVDQMIKAGKFAGTYVTKIQDFYSDKSHPRGDTGSYLIALCFYASLTGKDPRGVVPSSSYVRANPDASDAKVQSLIQQAVYDAMIYSGYSGLTTPMPGGPTVPPPPPPGYPAVGNIRVTVFNDADRDGVKDTGEAIWASVKVFLDTDNDGKLDAGEKSATTNSSGQATFSTLPIGNYRVRVIAPSNTKTTSANPVTTSVTTNTTKDVRTGLTRLGSISGKLFSDDNKNGRLDSGEALLDARIVFIDLDGDNLLDANEKRTTTDATGNYKFTGLTSGTYKIRRQLPGGYRISTPALNITLSAGQNFTNGLIGAAKT